MMSMMKPTLLVLAAATAIPAYSAPVRATEYWDWSMGSGAPTARQKARVKHVKRYRKKAKARTTGAASAAAKSTNDATRVMAYVRREGENVARADLQCAEKVRGLGTQWIGTEGALDAAKKDWMERVRYDYGESYLDMTNAHDFVSRCGRVSIGETMGQVMYRCEILARPCKGQMTETAAKK